MDFNNIDEGSEQRVSRPKTPRVVLDFNSARAHLVDKVRAGTAPEGMLCALELERRGWEISIADHSWHGLGGRFRKALHRFIEIPSMREVSQWQKGDVVVVVTRLAFALGLIVKSMGKKLVYVDVFYELPTRWWRRLLAKACLSIADGVGTYTRYQRDLWSRSFRAPPGKIVSVTYGLDERFFHPLEPEAQDGAVPYIMAVGRDPARDLGTVVRAARQLRWHAKLVTLPYLLPADIIGDPSVTVLQRIEYPELFWLYGNAAAAVVPIKPGVEYVAGVRAVMEAMLLGVPVVATRTPCLAELFEHDREVVFVEAGDADAVADAVRRLREEPEFRERIVSGARHKMLKSHTVSRFADSLERFFGSLA